MQSWFFHNRVETLAIHQNSYAEIFRNTDCRYGTRNLVESSAGKTKKAQTVKSGPLLQEALSQGIVI